MTRKVEVVPYHTDWPDLFVSEAQALRRVLGDEVLSIHRFGSTAIPGVSAKPVIDILVIVRDITVIDALTPRLVAIGYHPVGEYGIPGRRFFYKGTEDLRSHHLHIYQSGNPHILRHLVFRDYMRTHPEPARNYTLLKEELARQFPEDMDQYIAGKNEFVREQEKIALEWWWEKKK